MNTGKIKNRVAAPCIKNNQKEDNTDSKRKKNFCVLIKFTDFYKRVKYLA